MPIDKATSEKTCINGCGELRKAKPDQPDFLSHFIPSIARNDSGKTFVNIGTGYALEIWVCPKCRYIELYDYDLRELGDYNG